MEVEIFVGVELLGPWEVLYRTLSGVSACRTLRKLVWLRQIGFIQNCLIVVAVIVMVVCIFIAVEMPSIVIVVLEIQLAW